MRGRWVEAWASALTDPNASVAATSATRSRRLMRQPMVQCGSAPDRPLRCPLTRFYTGVTASGVIGITNERRGRRYLSSAPRVAICGAWRGLCLNAAACENWGENPADTGALARQLGNTELGKPPNHNRWHHHDHAHGDCIFKDPNRAMRWRSPRRPLYLPRSAARAKRQHRRASRKLTSSRPAKANCPVIAAVS